MPRTCTAKHTTTMSSKASILKNKTPHQHQNIILRLFSPLNVNELQQLIEESLQHIRTEYYNSQSTFEIDKILRFCQSCSHVKKICIFFLLLNIDQTTKEHLLDVDGSLNDRKLVRFFVDLKRYIVPNFFASDKITPSQFVDECENLYVIS